jgi:hypothetical protein
VRCYKRVGCLLGQRMGPGTLKVIGQAFDEAWVKIAHHFQDPPEIEAARLRLANIVLVLANGGTGDPEGLRSLALQMMALTYRRLRAASPAASTETPPKRA